MVYNRCTRCNLGNFDTFANLNNLSIFDNPFIFDNFLLSSTLILLIIFTMPWYLTNSWISKYFEISKKSKTYVYQC